MTLYTSVSRFAHLSAPCSIISHFWYVAHKTIDDFFFLFKFHSPPVIRAEIPGTFWILEELPGGILGEFQDKSRTKLQEESRDASWKESGKTFLKKNPGWILAETSERIS